MRVRTAHFIIALASCMLFCPFSIKADNPLNTLFKGKVIDAETGEPIPFVNILVVDTELGTISDMDGDFVVHASESEHVLKLSSIGYETLELTIVWGNEEIYEVRMRPQINDIEEVFVKPKKVFYRNKNNPSVELIKKVIENKSKNRMKSVDSYEYEKYEKVELALSDVTEKFMKRRAFKKFQFVFDNIDTTQLNGTKILPVYISENLSDCYYQKKPSAQKEIVRANKMVSFDGYVDGGGVSDFLSYLYQDIDIYDNNILFVTNMFLSPLANTAPAFYQYFIQDTTMVDDVNCVKVFFTPRNKNDMLFQGSLYVAIDKEYAITKVELTVNKNINLNWVKDVKIHQEFKNLNNEGWLLNEDEIAIDFGVTDRSMGFYGQRKVSYKDYKINQPIADTIFNGLDVVERIDKNADSNEYWEANRHKPLSASEAGTYMVTDSIQNIPVFKKAMNIGVLLLAGYTDLGKYEIGPVNTFYSYNPIEGVRVRAGGRTTSKFSKKLFLENYLAYGFTDKKPKYYLGATYSLTDRTIYEFPVKSVKLSVQNETKIPGQGLDFVQEDNVLLSIKRGVNNKLFYNETIKLEHLNEFENHFSYTLGYSYNQQSPAGVLDFKSANYEVSSFDPEYLTVSEFKVGFRYAPHEKFYQGRTYRKPIPNKYPIYQLQYTAGFKALGSDYYYHNLKFKMYKRFYLGVLGYSDTMWEAGKLFGQVSYPQLSIHRANQTYAYQLGSYNLMNFLEFVSDQYVSVNIDHYFNGFFFNKIPLLKRLKLREVVSAKVLYGGVGDQNIPDNDNTLFRFPTDGNGNTTTFTLENKPYIEVSAGVTNIFNFFRVDVVRRLTYLNNPTVTPMGIRVRFRLDI